MDRTHSPPPAQPAVSPAAAEAGARTLPADNFMSVSRPMSDEERAALEEVYRERGCGVECDC